MHIVVCVKHVVDSTEIHVDKKTNELVLRGLSTKINDYDKNAVEEAVRLKKELGATVSLVTIGPRDAQKTLKEALAMGADDAYLLQISPRQQLDTAQASLILSKMIEKLEPVDLVLCGEVSEDGYNSQTGARIAERLHLPQVSYVTKLSAQDGGYVAESTLEDTAETLKGATPALLTISSAINVPRLPTAIQIMKVRTSRIKNVKLADLGLDDSVLETPKVKMLGYEIPEQERKNIMIDGTASEAAASLVKYLQEEKVM